ncbi:MAG: ABC transporter substrate-binding protein [Lachnospiraceae bacterium]|nr:ABC transporter substrate-binding protein [Lachnospiraceae bacterium]MDY2956016.1 ABC transporter substrate-binding protein [Lachnospiraceae bacterium]
MKKKAVLKVLGVLSTISVFGGVLAGCGGSAGRSSETKSAVADSNAELNYIVTHANTQTTLILDPAVDYSGQKSMNAGMTEALFYVDDNTHEVTPWLAESIKQTDNTTWVIKIKDGIKFSNGKEFDAAAAKAAIEYIIKDGNNKRLRGLLKASSIDADGLTLTVHTDGINAVVPNVLADVNMIMFDVNENSDDYNKGLTGTGPYILQKKDAEGNMDLIRNENYWAGKPAAAAIHTKSGLDSTAQVNAMLNEEIDFVQLSGTQGADISRFEADTGKFDIKQFDQGRLFYLYINPDAVGTKDAKVREALQYAFDRDAIVSGVYGGRASATTSIFPKDSRFYQENDNAVSHNAEKARNLLREAGYTDTNNDGFVDKDGVNLKLHIVNYSANGFPTLSEVLQSQLKEVGIDADLETSGTITESLKSGNYNIGTYAYSTQTDGDAYNYLQPVFKSDGTSNFNSYSNAEVDKLLTELTSTTDANERAQKIKDIQNAIYKDDDTHIFLCHILSYKISRKNITNMTGPFLSDNGDNSILYKIGKTN